MKTEFKITDKLSDMKASLSIEYRRVYHAAMRQRGTHKNDDGRLVRNYVTSTGRDIVPYDKKAEDRIDSALVYGWDGTKRELKQVLAEAIKDVGHDDVTLFLEGRVDEIECSPVEYMRHGGSCYNVEPYDHFGIQINP